MEINIYQSILNSILTPLFPFASLLREQRLIASLNLLANMTKKLPPEIKINRRPTRVACEFCHSKHLQCDESRPCKNCVKRGLRNSCQDVVRKKKIKTQKGIGISLKKRKNPGELILRDLNMQKVNKGLPKKRGRKRKNTKASSKSFNQTHSESSKRDQIQQIDTVKQNYDETITPGSGMSKAILPYSISITTLNKLLSPLQDLPPLISDEQFSRQDFRREPGQTSKRSKIIDTTQTEAFQSDSPFISDYQIDIGQDKGRESHNGNIQQPPITQSDIQNKQEPGKTSGKFVDFTTELITKRSFQFAVAGNKDSNMGKTRGHDTPSDNQLNLSVSEIPTDNLNRLVTASEMTKGYPASISSSSLPNEQIKRISTDDSTKFGSTVGAKHDSDNIGSFSTSMDQVPESNHSLGSSDAQSDSSGKNFISTSANDEYSKLTDLIRTNPASPSNELWKEISQGTDDGYIFLPYIEIDVEDNTMKTSYPNNNTPISNGNNARPIQQMPNTAREIPHDLQEEEDYTSPLIMRHLIKKPDDIYLTSIVKAYQYPKAYHALISYLKVRFNKEQLIEVAKSMAKYRPSFISATKSLYENDLIFTERSFQRTLLEYEHLINMSPSPTIIWRRTGEIVALTSEFATMTGYSKMSLLSKRTFIVELMDDESALRYFRSFSEMAFGDLNATYLTNCSIRKANEDKYLKCSCVWTIKRDVFDIPMLIVGQFLPVLF